MKQHAVAIRIFAGLLGVLLGARVVADPPGGMPRHSVSPAPSTNRMDAASPDYYRVVTNHVSLPARAPFWKTLRAKCLAVHTNEALMQEITLQQVFGADDADTPSSPYYGAAAAKHLISEEHVPGKRFMLRNCPEGVAAGGTNEWVLIAMPIGTTNAGSEVLELWDCGVPYETWLSRQPHPTATRTNQSGQ